MIWVVLGFLTLVACELFLRLPFLKSIQDVLANGRKAGRVLRSKRISDTWKEKVMPLYSLKMGVASMKLLLFLFAVASPFVMMGFFLEGGFVELSALLMRPVVFFGMLLGAAGYMIARRKMTWNRTTP